MPDWVRHVREHLDLAGLDPDRAEKRILEVAQQLEECHQEGLASGLSEDDAAARARGEIVDWGTFAAEILWAEGRRAAKVRKSPAPTPVGREGRMTGIPADLRRDIAFGLHMLRRAPAFTAVAILTLALGIGANTAIFSAVHAVILRPFPYPEPDRLAMIYTVFQGGEIFWSSEPDVQDLRDQSTLFEDFAALNYGSTTLLGEGGPQRVSVAVVSANLFPVLRVGAALGRVFTPEEGEPGSAQVAILSYEFWQSRFGGDPDVVGKTAEVDSSSGSLEVIGVLPQGFRMLVPRHTNFPSRIDIWYPDKRNYREQNRGNRNMTVVGRLVDGATWEQAQQELDSIAQRRNKEYGSEDQTVGFEVRPLHGDTVEEARPALLTLLGASGFILMIACVNVANLTLARGATRRRELAIRATLGATRSRLIRQALTESSVLAVVGGIAGCLVAWAGVRTLSSYLPSKLPRLEAIRIDMAVLGFSIALALVAALLVGVMPALRLSRVDPESVLKEGTRGRTAGSPSGLFRSSLVVGETALSFVLLVGGGLMVHSFLKLQSADTGYRAAGTLTFTVSLPSSRYDSNEKKVDFFYLLQDRIRGLPGVESVGGNMLLPFGRSLFIPTFTFYDTTAAGSGGAPIALNALARPTLPGYFEALDARLVAGRTFQRSDVAGGELVAIIDDTLARAVWPGENPIGKRLARGDHNTEPEFRKVIGVVENLRLTSLTGERMKQVYLPISQFTPPTMSYLVRTRLDPTTLLGPIRSEVQGIDASLPLYEIAELDATLSEVMAPQRLTSLLMILFSTIGLALAAVGVYGVISYSVSQRTHEIGIRFALGARLPDVYLLVFRQGLLLAAVGMALGVVGAVALTRWIESQLFGVTSLDTWAYVVATITLIAAAVLACWFPARRAGRVDPMVALRIE